MKPKNLIQILFPIFLILIATNTHFAQDIYEKLAQNYLDDSAKKTSLKGIKSLNIEVSILQENLEQAGLNENNLKSEVETKLRDVGINIVKQKEPYLDITINSVKTNENVFSYSIDVLLRQKTVLAREKSVFVIAPTWERGAIGSVGTGRIDTIRESVLRFVDEFIKDYIEVNKLSSSTKQNQKIVPKPTTKQEDSPFTATYVGGNRPPEVEIFNDTDRTLYLDFGQDTLTPYTIPPKTSKKFTLTEGIYKYKATVPQIAPIAGQDTFQKGYVYTWRFVIVTQRIN